MKNIMRGLKPSQNHYTMQVKAIKSKQIINQFYYLVLILLFFTSCHNRKYPYIDVYFDQNGDTSSITINEFLGKGLYKSIIYNYKNGTKLKQEETRYFKNAMPHGKSKYYHANGKLKSVVIYNHGKIWEIEEYLDSKGNKLDYGRLNKGEGYLREFRRDSDLLEEEGKVINGYKEGFWPRYDGSGKRVIDSTFYDKGKSEIMKEIEEVGFPAYQIYE